MYCKSGKAFEPKQNYPHNKNCASIKNSIDVYIMTFSYSHEMNLFNYKTDIYKQDKYRLENQNDVVEEITISSRNLPDSYHHPTLNACANGNAEALRNARRYSTTKPVPLSRDSCATGSKCANRLV